MNFVECITWNKRIPKNDKGVGNIHDFVLVYVKVATSRHEFYMRKDGLEDIDDLVTNLRKSKCHSGTRRKRFASFTRSRDTIEVSLYIIRLINDIASGASINMSWPNGITFGPRKSTAS